MRFPDIIECKICGKKRQDDKYFHPGTALCNSCFQKERKKLNFQRWQKDEDLVCKKCGTHRQDTYYFNIENQLCGSCYQELKRREKGMSELPIKDMTLICKECGKHRTPNEKFYSTLLLCNSCYQKHFREEHPKYLSNWEKERKERDPIYKLRRAVHSNIAGAFKRKSFSKNNQEIENILGCSIEEFYQYITNKFTEGMTIENYGEWELDHIIPISSAKTEQDVYRLCHYTNYQPLWSLDNKKKGNKIIDDYIDIL